MFEYAPEPVIIETGFDASGDGYAWAAMISARRDSELLASWGRDGWDLGSWPLVTVAFVDRIQSDDDSHTRLFGFVERCEGDLTVRFYDTTAKRTAAVDAAARWWWNRDPEQHGPDMAAILAAMPETVPLPERFTGRFSWDRLRAFQEVHDYPNCQRSEPVECPCKCHGNSRVSAYPKVAVG